MTLTGSNALYGSTTITGGTLQLGTGASGCDGSLSASGTINNNATLAYNIVRSQTYSGVIGGSGSLTKAGSGVLTLGGANTFYGTTTISGGTLDLCNGKSLQGSTVVAPTAGSIVFDQNAGGVAFSFGGLRGRNINLPTTPSRRPPLP